MSENFDTAVTVKCGQCGKEFEGYKGQKPLCIACFDKQVDEREEFDKKILKKIGTPLKSWTPFHVPKLVEEEKWQDLRTTIPGNSETWYRVQKTTGFIGIAIHHTAGPKTQSPNSIALYHVNVRGWGGIGYHFLIGQNGTVYYVGDVKTQRAHIANLNHKYIGISMIGNFMDSKPTEEQLRSVYLLNKELVEIDNRFNISWGEVKRHNELGSTACPGNTWPEWWGKVLKDGKSCLELDEDISAEIEGKFNLKNYGWYNKYWTGREFIRTVTKDYTKCLEDLEDCRKDYQKEKSKALLLEKEVTARDKAIEGLGKQVKAIESERDGFREQVIEEANKLIKERKLWNEKKEKLNEELLKQLATIKKQEKEIKLLSYIKDSVTYKVGQFIVELIESLKGGGKK